MRRVLTKCVVDATFVWLRTLYVFRVGLVAFNRHRVSVWICFSAVHQRIDTCAVQYVIRTKYSPSIKAVQAIRNFLPGSFDIVRNCSQLYNYESANHLSGAFRKILYVEDTDC